MSKFLLLSLVICYCSHQIAAFKVNLYKQLSVRLFAGFGKQVQSSDSIEKKSSLDGSSKCTCGSGLNYIDCCQSYHKAGGGSDSVALIRSRYSAYSNDDPDYIIGTTSKTCSDYSAFMDSPINPANSLKRWTKSIRSSIITDYYQCRMEVVSSEVSDTSAKILWRHLAIRKADNVMYPIEETSTLVKSGDKWYYESGVVQR